MASLTKCKSCGNEISKNAKACPHCGEPAPPKTSLFTWLILILLVLGIFGSISPNNSSSSASSVSNQEKIAQKQQQAKEQKIQQEKANDLKYFSQNKELIIQDINLKIQNKQYDDALNMATKYPSYRGKDENISKIYTELVALVAEEKREKQIQHKKEILAELKSIPASDYTKNKQLYQTLLNYEPTNNTYKEKVVFYTKQIEKEKEDAKLKQLGLKWKYQEDEDKMGRGTKKHAFVSSLNNISFDFPYQGLQRATLQLRKHPKYGKDVILSIEKGQFLCNSYDGCRVAVRFDNGKPLTYRATEPSDHDTTVIFINDYNSFVSRAKKSKKIYIEAEFFQQGFRVMEFNSEGLNF